MSTNDRRYVARKNESSDVSLVSRWLLRLFGYDGLLPAFVFAFPGLLVLAFGPGLHLELAAVVLPIVAFFYRAAIGLGQIEANFCRTALRRIQKATLFFALLILLVVDAFVILLWALPPAALTRMDYLVAAGLYFSYLILMAISIFPGFPISPSSLDSPASESSA